MNRLAPLLMFIIIIMFIVVCLTGCQRYYNPDFCLFLNPISYSGDKDTAETIEQIQEYNAVWEEFCDAE